MMTSTNSALIHFSDSLYRGPSLSGPVGWLVAHLLPLGHPGECCPLRVWLAKREHVSPAMQRSVPAAGASGPPPRSSQGARLEARGSEMPSTSERRTTNQSSLACGITQSSAVGACPPAKRMPGPLRSCQPTNGQNPKRPSAATTRYTEAHPFRDRSAGSLSDYFRSTPQASAARGAFHSPSANTLARRCRGASRPLVPRTSDLDPAKALDWKPEDARCARAARGHQPISSLVPAV